MPDLFTRDHARNTDPDTSHAAAEEAHTVADRHRLMIVVQLQRGPQTAGEIAEAIGLHVSQVNRRTGDLIADGLVEDTGSRRRGPNGRMMRVLRRVG